MWLTPRKEEHIDKKEAWEWIYCAQYREHTYIAEVLNSYNSIHFSIGSSGQEVNAEYLHV